MKDPVLAVMTALKTDAAISGVVSTRVYRVKLPASPVFPAITVSEISDISDDDTSTSTNAHTRIQCTAWSISDGEAGYLSKLIRKSMHGITNPLLTSGIDPVLVISCMDAGSHPDVNTDVTPEIFMYHRDFLIEYAH